MGLYLDYSIYFIYIWDYKKILKFNTFIIKAKHLNKLLERLTKERKNGNTMNEWITEWMDEWMNEWIN